MAAADADDVGGNGAPDPGERSDRPDLAAQKPAEGIGRGDEHLDSGPPDGERLVEEELPPGFWEEAHEPHPPSPRQRQQVRADPDRPPHEQVSVAPAARASGASATPAPALSDPAFATLQALFPGRILSIEVDEVEAAEESVEGVADQGSDPEPEDQGE